jgi:hypothetical protein
MNTYIELAKRGREYGETNFCTVIAVALCLKTTFEDAWNLMNSKGRRIGKGTTFNDYSKALEERGMTVNNIYSRHRWRDSRTGKVNGYSDPEVSASFPRARYIKTVNDLTTYLPRTGTFLVRINKHVLTFVNGKVEDWTDNRRHRVLAIYEVTGTPVTYPDAVMPMGLHRHREEGRTGFHSAVRTRKDTPTWNLIRRDTGTVVNTYKRLSERIKRGVQTGTIQLTSDPSVPLFLHNVKTGETISKRNW